MTTAKLPELSEKQVTEQIIGFLKSRQWHVMRLQSGLMRIKAEGKKDRFMRLGEKGVPDWIAVRGREALFIEMKRPGKTLSKDQANWHEWAQIQGMLILWADSLGAFMLKYQQLIGNR